jgi:hypothetical protein
MNKAVTAPRFVNLAPNGRRCAVTTSGQVMTLLIEKETG